jgi:hypothetical protein
VRYTGNICVEGKQLTNAMHIIVLYFHVILRVSCWSVRAASNKGLALVSGYFRCQV